MSFLCYPNGHHRLASLAFNFHFGDRQVQAWCGGTCDGFVLCFNVQKFQRKAEDSFAALDTGPVVIAALIHAAHIQEESSPRVVNSVISVRFGPRLWKRANVRRQTTGIGKLLMALESMFNDNLRATFIFEPDDARAEEEEAE